MSADTPRSLEQKIQNARQCLALVHVTLAANVESIENSDGDPVLYHASERAAELALEALVDLDDIDLPRPIMEWQPTTTTEELLEQFQEYARGGRQIARRAKQLQKTAGGAR